MTTRSICLITSGHLASCPRIVKAADAAAEDGWKVTVVAASSLPAQREIDRGIAARRAWRLQQFEWGRDRAATRNQWLRGRYRGASVLASWLGPHTPEAVTLRAAACPAPELTALAIDTGAQFYYGGGWGGTVIAAAAARATGTRFGVDFEDLHSGATAAHTPAARYWHTVEDRLLRSAAVVTAGSEAIADSYTRRARRDVIPVHNTVPLPTQAPDFAGSDRVRCYWFGQFAGPGRGLEECIDALAAAGTPATVTVRATADAAYIATLAQRAERTDARLSLEHLPFAHPEVIASECGRYDVGLAFELGHSENNRRALSNKVLTYVASGVAPLVSRTEGTERLIQDLGAHALAAAPSTPSQLLTVVERMSDRGHLACARRAAHAAAVRRWRWDHPLEKGRLLAAFESVVQ